jgi:hypothetical protein
VHDRLITSNFLTAYKPQSKTVSQMVFVRRRLSNLNWRQQAKSLIHTRSDLLCLWQVAV